MGECAVEDLRVGDQVNTLEFGSMTVRWLARRDVGAAEFSANASLVPVRIKPGLLGNHRAVLISKQHCVLVTGPDGATAYAKAGHLAEQTSIASYARGRCKVAYYHLLLDRHATVFANGLPCESFYPGPKALSMLTPQDRTKLLRMLPDLGRAPAEEVYGQRAARVLRRREVAGIVGAVQKQIA